MTGDKLKKIGEDRKKGHLTHEERHSKVNSLIVASGESTKNAISLVAEMEGVTFKAIERSYYIVKNRP